MQKIQIIHLALTEQRCDMGRQPFQDLDLLLSLRNALVHSRPEQLYVVEALTPEGIPTHRQKKLTRLVERLVGRGIVAAPPESVLTSQLAVLHHPRVGACDVTPNPDPIVMSVW